MRTPVVSVLLSSFQFLFSAAANAFEHSPFQPAPFEQVYGEGNAILALSLPLGLLKRQGACPSKYNPCNNLGAAGLCCYSTATCQLDQANHVACCPTGSTCTGTVGVSPQTVFATTTTLTSGQPTVIAGGILITTPPPVSNQYYTYPAIPTTFVNAAACSSAWSSCQTEYSSCTARLAGRTAGITISAANAGITIAAATTISDPASICSSLSQQACNGLQTIYCPAYGAARAAATVCGPGMYGVGMGVALGIAGGVLV